MPDESSPDAARAGDACSAFLARFGSDLPARAAVALVVAHGRILASGGWGTHAPDDGRVPTLDSQFDLASLTKPIVATLALRLDRCGALSSRARIGDLVVDVHPDLARVQVGTLLRHRAGLAAWTPLMVRCRTPSEVLALLLSGGRSQEGVALLGTRPGTYSDLGYILWGLLAERALDGSLADLVAEHVTRPLGMSSTGPSPGVGDHVVACRLDNGAEVRLAAAQGHRLETETVWRRGMVQDGNARFMGGLGGHAGLFGSARDLLKLAEAWREPESFLGQDRARRALAGRGPFALGWARRRVRGSAGPALSAAALGHVGFTGGSVWMDPSTGRTLILLAHRRHSSSDVNRQRRRFHAWASALP